MPRRSAAWLLVLVAAAGALAAGLALWVRRSPQTPASAAPLPMHEGSPPVAAPEARFVDITREAGITFEHENGADGQKLLPETMGGGVAFFDFDRDGRPDLLFVDSRPWPWSAPKNGRAAPVKSPEKTFPAPRPT